MQSQSVFLVFVCFLLCYVDGRFVHSARNSASYAARHHFAGADHVALHVVHAASPAWQHSCSLSVSWSGAVRCCGRASECLGQRDYIISQRSKKARTSLSLKCNAPRHTRHAEINRGVRIVAGWGPLVLRDHRASSRCVCVFVVLVAAHISSAKIIEICMRMFACVRAAHRSRSCRQCMTNVRDSEMQHAVLHITRARARSA